MWDQGFRGITALFAYGKMHFMIDPRQESYRGHSLNIDHSTKALPMIGGTVLDIELVFFIDGIDVTKQIHKYMRPTPDELSDDLMAQLRALVDKMLDK